MNNVRVFLGASTKLARIIAEYYAKKGDTLILVSHDSEDLHRTADHIQVHYKSDIHILPCDLQKASISSLESICEDIKTLSEGKKLHILSMPLSEEFVTLEHVMPPLQNLLALLENFAAYLEKKQKGSLLLFTALGRNDHDVTEYDYIYTASQTALSCYATGLRKRLSSAAVSVMTVHLGSLEAKKKYLLFLPKIRPALIAKSIIQAHEKKKNILHISSFWRYLIGMLLLFSDFIRQKISS